jgi:beta-glucosidase
VGHLGAAAQPTQQLVNGEWQGIASAPRDPDGRRYVPYWDDARAPSAPQFALGWGLSYTRFAYASLRVVAAAAADWRARVPRVIAGRAALRAAAAARVATATVRVCNAGARDGTEVVVLYAADPRGGRGGGRAVAPFVKRVVGFARLPLAAGACGDALIDVSADDLAQHETDYAGADLRLAVIPGAYVFSTGRSAREDVLNATLIIE